MEAVQSTYNEVRPGIMTVCPVENIPSIEEMLGPVLLLIISLLSSVRTEMTSVKNYNFSGGQTESHVSCPVSSSVQYPDLTVI